MKFVIQGRGWGKTKLLVELACANRPSVIVTFNEAERKRVMNMVNKKIGNEFMQVNVLNIQDRLPGGEGASLYGTRGPVYVDNADYILELLIGRDVDTATFTAESE